MMKGNSISGVAGLCLGIMLLVFPVCWVGSASAEQFTRKTYQYDKMEKKDWPDCSKEQAEILDLAMKQVDSFHSEQAVQSAGKVYLANNKCPRADGVYAWCLFRSGEWLKAIEAIDAAIDKYGARPDLVKARGLMGHEMGDLGTQQKSIDGNGEFGSFKDLPFNEEQFKKENYKAALNDFSFLIKDHPERYDERYRAAYLHYMLGGFEKSIQILEGLRDVKEFRNNALMGMTNGYIAMKQFDAAEKILLEMEREHPRAPRVQAQFVNLYTANGNADGLRDHQKKMQFYGVVPPFSDLAFTEENYKLVALFADEDNKRNRDKEKKFKQIINGADRQLAIDMCIILLALDPHGSPLEQMASDALIRYGKDAVPKTIQLLQARVMSTCTTTKAAEILATIKDERGWQPIVDYLPQMTNLPYLLMPPAVPEMMMKFDKNRAVKVLLPFIRDMMRKDQEILNLKDPKQITGESMAYSMFCYPFRSFDKTELLKLAKDNGYTEEEAQALIAKASTK